MPRSVRYLRSAEADIERIIAFLSKETAGRAERAIDRLEHGFENLCAFPEMGVAIGRGLRQMVIRDRWNAFVVRYHVKDDAILITRIWHGLEDRPR
ncbi:MAG: type II toxin-antitoxin system RelE/ParE family toxin [Caulobacterales bacterium]|jgi:plasmid stabilization system protein ParE|nr:type II toxin-antitoxin system RelE/ParE family toxin [Caulobacterales bacterium]